MFSKEELIYLGTCLIFAQNHYGELNSQLYAKNIYRDVFGENEKDKENMILE